MNAYQAGSHIIASLESTQQHLLSDYKEWKKCIDKLILQHQLQMLGEVYHNFQPAGFTAIVCLSESHISIHTWPEYAKVNIDIYLSNYQRDNDGTVDQIFNAAVAHFGATIVAFKKLKR
ncbi:MAG: adenosylmethionine decarboxylase [Chitinophagaceae bacterium]|nr:adenosylmethionine decarboxylase [Chitinophagaceae bacterium]